jgi:hypothetical protein
VTKTVTLSHGVKAFTNYLLVSINEKMMISQELAYMLKAVMILHSHVLCTRSHFWCILDAYELLY